MPRDNVTSSFFSTSTFTVLEPFDHPYYIRIYAGRLLGLFERGEKLPLATILIPILGMMVIYRQFSVVNNVELFS